MPAIPLRGDRSAWNSASYQSLHANDIDTSASAIHHSLGIGAFQAASGSHVHDSEGGSGSSVINHSHSGSQVGDGGKLGWDNVWSDAVHDHSGSAEGGKITASNLSSGAAVYGSVLTADGSGSSIWSPTSGTITTLDNIENVYVPAPNDGDVLSWNASTGSWVAYRPVDWRVTLTQDTNTDDSDKIFTVPESYEWQILWVWVEYTSTATGGTRQLEIQIQDASSNVIGQFQTGVTQSGGPTYKYLFGIGVPDLTTVRDDNNVTTPLGAATFLSAGQKIRIWDNNTVDASADDMVVRIQYASRNLSIEDFNPPTGANNNTHLQTSDKIQLIQYRILAINNSTQLQTSSKPILSWRFMVLTTDNAVQIQTSGVITLPAQTHGLIVNNSTQLQTFENVTLTQYQILIIHNISQKLISDKTTLSIIEHSYVLLQNIEMTQTVDNIEITLYSGVDTQYSSQTQTSENIILFSSSKYLVMNDSAQLQAISDIGMMVTNKPTLSMKNAIQLITSNKVTFSNMTTLAINSSIQSQNSDKIMLTQNQKPLSLKDTDAKLISDKITLQNILYNGQLGISNSNQISISDKITLV